MQQYIELSKRILSDDRSYYKPNRTSVDTISLFCHQSIYNLEDGFPLLTTKKMHTRSIFNELLWFLRGETNIKPLNEKGVTIWDEWADENGELGPIYGCQWRNWESKDGRKVDQIKRLIDIIKNDPNSRRQIVSAWNVGELHKMSLEPCHVLFQTNVRGSYLDLCLYQRSCDVFLGVPFNIASYSLLTHLLANECGLKPGYFTHFYADAHFYCGRNERGRFYEKNLDKLKTKVRDATTPLDFLEIRDWIIKDAPGGEEDEEDHIPKILLQLSRRPRPLPTIVIPKDKSLLEEIIYGDHTQFIIKGYNPYPTIRAKVAV